jgi:hypothetical protein
MQARKRGLAQQLLNKDTSKSGPMIGRDRLSVLRANEAARNGGSPPNALATEMAAAGSSSSTSQSPAPPSSNPRDPLITTRRVEQV